MISQQPTPSPVHDKADVIIADFPGSVFVEMHHGISACSLCFKARTILDELPLKAGAITADQHKLLRAVYPSHLKLGFIYIWAPHRRRSGDVSSTTFVEVLCRDASFSAPLDGWWSSLKVSITNAVSIARKLD